MSVSFAIATILEICVGLFLIIGFFNEQKFVDFEDRLLARFRAKRTPAKIIRFQPRASHSGRDIS